MAGILDLCYIFVMMRERQFSSDPFKKNLSLTQKERMQ